MDLPIGSRVRARGLIWDVLESEQLGAQQRLRLRCAGGDLSGLEWDLLRPADTVEPLTVELQPDNPGALAAWRLHHMACLLDQLPDRATVLATDPGRIRIEPYQLVPLMRALELPRPRLLLADGVGLGKTIEAGLIAVELIARRRAHRILVVAPAGPLLTQWEQELRSRFGLRFTRLADSATLHEERRKLELGGNPFAANALCLTSLDFAKQEPVLEALERTTWDLGIIDEAHHCVSAATSTDRDDTMRRRLAEVVAKCSDGLLLLTATPHDGYDPHFASLIELLDPSLVDGKGGLAGFAYRRHVVRRLKAHLRDPVTGRPLFRERRITPVPVDVAAAAVQEFHRALSALVAPRFRRGTRSLTTTDALAFVSLLKRSGSTIAACLCTLRAVADRYAEIATGEAAPLRRERLRALRAYRRRAARFGVLDQAAEDDSDHLEAEEIAADLVGTGGTIEALRGLIHLGQAAKAQDPKLAAMLTEVRLIRLAHPGANIQIYTEYAASQAAAVAALHAGIGGEVLAISGQDSEAARTAAAEQFAAAGGIVLVSTDALAEGLNLQARCCHLIHLDLPYNPNRLEQRNGRIDRYGQAHEPDIRYLYLAGTFEEHVLLRLIGKYEKARAALTVMPDTLGVTADHAVVNAGLIAGFAERQATLFGDDAPSIRSLDRLAEEENAAAYRDLLHEIDRAYGGFEQMAVRHGWLADRGLNADAAQLAAAGSAETRGSALLGRVDLLEFTEAAIAMEADPGSVGRQGAIGDQHVAETGGETAADRALPLPADWRSGIDGLPGYDAVTRSITVTPDRGSVHESPAYLGRAHPLVRRAITRARLSDAEDSQTDHRVSAARAEAGDGPALLLTYGAEIRSALRLELQCVLAVRLPMDGPPALLDDVQGWLRLGHPTRAIDPPGLWQRLFASWAPLRRPVADAFANAAMQRIAAPWLIDQADRIDREAIDLELWLGKRAEDLCGSALPRMDDLFGSAPVRPVWQDDAPPLHRLAAYAADAINPSLRRRAARSAVELYQRREKDRSDRAALSPPVLRPIGLLMLVPAESGA
jgi:superfamily II DNA or RNA helicase